MNPYGDTEIERKIAELAGDVSRSGVCDFETARDALRRIVYQPLKMPNIEDLKMFGVKPGPLTMLGNVGQELIAAIWRTPPFSWIDAFLWWVRNRM